MLVDEPLADHFRGFAAAAERDGGTVYPAICRYVAEDDEVLSLLDHAPLPQRRPLILLASVHDLLLAGAEHPLAAHYDTVATVRGIPFHPTHSDVATDFADFCRLHRDELERLVATRTTQTNEVGRCTSLLPALCHIAAGYPASTPLSLLDLGTSAGLNLLFDDYDYTYRQEGGDHTVTAGRVGAAVGLECRVRGDIADLPALRAPAVAARVGLDLSPIDPRAPGEARWLLACQWPENPARFGRLRSALGNVAASDHPPRLEQGDMIHDLARVARTIEGDGPLRRLPLLDCRLPGRSSPGSTGGSHTGARPSHSPRPPSLCRVARRDAGPAHTALSHPAGRPRPCDCVGPSRAGWRRNGPPGRYSPTRLLDPLVWTVRYLL